jgi:hypothetical protein
VSGAGVSGEAPLRAALHGRVDADSIVCFDEFWVPLTAERADVAAIRGEELEGFELKSALDTLERLPRQVGAYGRVFDRCTLVVAARHVQVAMSAVPDWWGVIVVDQDGCFRADRPAEVNPGPLDPATLVRLLWKRDVAAELVRLQLLSARGSARSGRSRDLLWHMLLEHVELDELRACVRRALIRRACEWRGGKGVTGVSSSSSTGVTSSAAGVTGRVTVDEGRPAGEAAEALRWRCEERSGRLPLQFGAVPAVGEGQAGG